MNVDSLAHLHVREFLKFIRQGVHSKFARQIPEPSEGETLDRTIRNNTKDVVEIYEILSCCWDIEKRFLIFG